MNLQSVENVENFFMLEKFRSRKYDIGNYAFEKVDQNELCDFLKKLSSLTCQSIDLMIHSIAAGFVKARYKKMGMFPNGSLRFLDPEINTVLHEAYLYTPFDHFHHAQLVVIGNYIKLMIVGAREDETEKLYEIHLDFR